MSSESEDSSRFGDSDAEEATRESVSRSPPYYSHYRSYSSDERRSYSSDERSSKRSRAREERDRTDRISALPESVIVHILSFLPTLDSVRTRVLSQRWQYLWTCVPTFYFNFTDKRRDYYSEDLDGTSELIDFVEFVDQTLVLCDGSVKNFKVKSVYQKQLASSVNLWARFASRNSVEKFELYFTSDEEYVPDDDIYMLPQFMYTDSKFRELRFSLCRIEPKKRVSWVSLKELSIGYVNLSDDTIRTILEGTPVLEKLELHHFECPDRLHIVNSSVKKLILREQWRRFGNMYPIEISAPNIHSLEISGQFPNCELVDVKSLVEATLFDLCLIHYSDDDMVKKAQGLFNSLAHVKTLTLGAWAIKGLATLRTLGSSVLRLIKCECLTINTELWMSHPLGISVLLRYFPLLKALIFTTSPFGDRWGQGYSYPLCSVAEEFSALPVGGFTLLKTVKFFRDWDDDAGDFQLEQILLKNAKILQQMIIHLGTRNSYYRSPDQMFKAARKLLSFHRSSPVAEVLIYE